MTLEDSPEFQAALNESCEKQYRGFLYGGEYAKAHSKDTIADTMEEMQRQRREFDAKDEDRRIRMEQAMLEVNIHARDITTNLKRKQGSKGLFCPVCGEGSHRNSINGKPYCFMNAKHNGLGPIPLMTPKKAKEWNLPKKSFKRKELWELDDSEVARARRRK